MNLEPNVTQVSFVLPNGHRANGTFCGWMKGSEGVIASVWRTPKRTVRADGTEVVGRSGFYYAAADTLKKARTKRPLKRFGKVIGRVDVRTGLEIGVE